MKNFDKKSIENLMDNLKQGLFYIDSNKTIRMANRSAREITGVNIVSTIGHEAGELASGDIVIIADNRLGGDDGDLSLDELKRLNIHDKSVRQGDILIAIGVYDNKKIEPEYKYVRDHQTNSISLDTYYYGFRIYVEIDLDNNMTKICVNGKVFELEYFQTIGNAVVISGTTGNIKFFQAKGYTVRHESIGEILRGGKWLKKKSDNTEFKIIGKDFMQVFDCSSLTDKLFGVIDGNEDKVINKLYDINKRPFICNIIPHVDETTQNNDGAFLLIQDACKLETALTERNKIIKQIEEQQVYEDKSNRTFPQGAFESFVGTSSKSKEVKYLAYKASKNNFNVIITGSSGTGKSKLAREIHNMWGKNKPFVEVNCNAIAPSLFESELFGYVKGAFTGALSEGKVGFFEAANNGTIFLDEIGEIPMDIQVKLLHVLQNKIIYRVGSSKPIKINTRIIAATNKNLAEEVEAGRFRQDLYYRINVFPIDIPPIKERKADLYILINQILNKVCKEYDMPLKQFSGEALHALISYDWPGNVRELENVIERAVTLCDTGIIYVEHLNIGVPTRALTLKEQMEIEEKRIISSTMKKNNGDKQKSMEELDMSKSVFYSKLKKYGI